MADDAASVTADQVQAKVAEISQMLSGGSSVRVLQNLFADPPASLKENGPKDAYAEVAVRALVGIKEADLQKTVESLNETELDNALKYVYYGLSTGQQASLLLKWHAAITDKAGVGSILKALTEKKVADNKAL